MSMSKVTEMAQYKATRQKPVTDACAWLHALELIQAAHTRIFYAAWRSWIRGFAK